MQRNYFRGMIICLVPTLIAGYFAVFGEYKKGIDLAGGTILVFEVDKEKTNARLSNEGRAAGFGQSDEDIKKLAENIKRRVDPVDTRGVIGRPVGDGRIEILLPFSEKKKAGQEQITEDFVQFVKNIVSQAGVLDYRILANNSDDDAGIRAAEDTIDRTPPALVSAVSGANDNPSAYRIDLPPIRRASSIPNSPRDGTRFIDERSHWAMKTRAGKTASSSLVASAGTSE